MLHLSVELCRHLILIKQFVNKSRSRLIGESIDPNLKPGGREFILTKKNIKELFNPTPTSTLRVFFCRRFFKWLSIFGRLFLHIFILVLLFAENCRHWNLPPDYTAQVLPLLVPKPGLFIHYLDINLFNLHWLYLFTFISCRFRSLSGYKPSRYD